jgi:SAM-dependent methyltransferase
MTTHNEMTWEQAVRSLKSQPEQRDLVLACFYDDPLIDAANRYLESSEWRCIRQLLPNPGGRALDVGAGRGIASFALSSDGWTVDALEPDPSTEVGAGAVRELARTGALPITVTETWGESIPYETASFDVVFCRQVLHHARDLRQLCRELARVLKPGGTFVAVREHVISTQEDLPAFLAAHPLHRLYGGECAYEVDQYRDAIQSAGIRLTHTLNPFESEINLYPETLDQLRARIGRKLHVPAGLVPDWLLSIAGRVNSTPGRLYSFAGVRNAS